MDEHIRGLAVASLLVAWVGLPSSAHAHPTPWAPAHGYRAKEYRYVYSPHHEIYYAPATQHWFWLDGGRWRVGTSLPSGIVVAGVPGVSVIHSTERPYQMNTYVVKRYGGKRHERHRRHRHDD